MMNEISIWDQFNMQFNAEKLARELEETKKESNFIRRKVPHDTYEIKVTKLELVKSKRGQPMVTCWMKIVEGEYKNNLIFMNQVVTQSFQIRLANKFMRKLVAEMADPIDVHFKTYDQYSNMIMDIMEAIENNFEYKVCYYNNKGYNAFAVEEVYPLN